MPQSLVSTPKEKLKIYYVPISQLKVATYNPRKISEIAMEQLKESIRQHSMVDPIIVNSHPARKNVVVGGHQRLAACKALGYKEVPVVYVRLTLEQEKSLNLRLNRVQGEWDYDLLKAFDVDLLLETGFDDQDLSNIWDDSLQTEDDGFNVEKELRALKKPKTKQGDIYQMGLHRLICGDSTRSEVVQKLLGLTRVDMLYCDGPYNIALDYNTGIGTNGKYGGIHTDDARSDADFRAFQKIAMQNGLTVAKKDCHVFWYSDESYIGMVQSLFSELGLTNRRVCLWIKNNQNPTPQVAFSKCYEACVYSTRGKPYLNKNIHNLNEVLNKEMGTGNRLPDDIMDMFNIWLVKRLPGQDYNHPTEKSPTLHEKALRRCTKPGDAVLDLFAGSGSLMVSCEQLKRRSYLVELEPIFCDLIVRRYEQLTGRKAKKLN